MHKGNVTIHLLPRAVLEKLGGNNPINEEQLTECKVHKKTPTSHYEVGYKGQL